MYRINVNPFLSELKPMASIFDELINSGLSTALGAGIMTSNPQINIHEDDKSFYIELAAPGLSKQDFLLNIENEVLTVKLEQKNEPEADREFIRREYRLTSFAKTFQLPKNIDRESISAKYEQGVLIISLPKRVEDQKVGNMNIEID